MPTQAKEIFEATSKSLREMLSENGLGLYLPPYQRPYGWDKGKVTKLIDDTLHGLRNLDNSPDSFTFLGTIITIHDINHVTVNPIVKPQVPAKVLTVIDGQQRISSLLLLLVGLHNQIRQNAWKAFKGRQPDVEKDKGRYQLYSETINILQNLGQSFFETRNYGASPIYPRLIRAFDDQWSTDTKTKKYESPIANLIFSYASKINSEEDNVKPAVFKPTPRPSIGNGEEDLTKRFKEIQISLNKLANNTTVEELEDLPPLREVARNTETQRALFNHELDNELIELLESLDKEPEALLMRLVMLAAYCLNRIALTVVQGKDEDYAFTIFESLNTTGEPLTAFETFLPRVIMAEGVSEYQNSKAHGYMENVKNFLNKQSAGSRLQNSTSDLLVTFALAETGKKLSKRLPDQRNYMRDVFSNYIEIEEQRDAFLENLSNTATFIGSCWDPDVDRQISLPGLPSHALSDTAKLCFFFLKALNHTIAIPPLVRFYTKALHQEPDSSEQNNAIQEFEQAIKSITAFTVFWRASRRGTGNIDSQYRSIMAGDSLTKVGPLARSYSNVNEKPGSPEPFINAEDLRSELRHRLSSPDHGGIPNLATFLTLANDQPLYSISKPLTRFILLAAHHDTVGDNDETGLITKGKSGVSPCLTLNDWNNEEYLTIEHIAPQQETTGWDDKFYKDPESLHKIGNLVLTPSRANTSLSSRPWEEKKILYAALGASTPDKARTTIEDSGIKFNQSTEELTQLSRHLPHLHSLGNKKDAFTEQFANERGVVLLRLAYLQLKDWLKLDWEEEDGAEIVRQLADTDPYESDEQE